MPGNRKFFHEIRTFVENVYFGGISAPLIMQHIRLGRIFITKSVALHKKFKRIVK